MGSVKAINFASFHLDSKDLARWWVSHLVNLKLLNRLCTIQVNIQFHTRLDRALEYAQDLMRGSCTHRRCRVYKNDKIATGTDESTHLSWKWSSRLTRGAGASSGSLILAANFRPPPAAAITMRAASQCLLRLYVCMRAHRLRLSLYCVNARCPQLRR